MDFTINNHYYLSRQGQLPSQVNTIKKSHTPSTRLSKETSYPMHFRGKKTQKKLTPSIALITALLTFVTPSALAGESTGSSGSALFKSSNEINASTKVTTTDDLKSAEPSVKEPIETHSVERAFQDIPPELILILLSAFLAGMSIARHLTPIDIEDRKTTAWHELGHATAVLIWNHAIKKSNPKLTEQPYKLGKLSVHLRGKHLGNTVLLPTEKNKIDSFLDVIAHSIIAVSGRAMEIRKNENILDVTPIGKKDWDEILKELEKFMRSGAIPGFNTTALQDGRVFRRKPQLSAEELQFINNFIDRMEGTMVEVFKQIPKDQLEPLVESILSLKGGETKKAEPLIRDALEGVNWDELAGMVNQLAVEPTRREMEEPTKKALAEAKKWTSLSNSTKT